ncbi:MAG: ATP-binding protein [Bacteroidota bacterium]
MSIIFGMVAAVLVFLRLTEVLVLNWGVLFFILLAFFCLSYFVVLNALKRYIYRKIKLIYKSIHRFKVTAKDKIRDVDINTDIIGEVEKEVSNWVNSQNKEIESLKSLEAYRRNFLGDISHELKTPIFSIQGYIHTLLDGGLYDEKINRSYLVKAASNVERLQTIVSDLESIAKLESGTLMLDMQPFDIRALAEEVLEDMEIMAKERKISLLFKEGADRGFTVHADRENIRQVLTNLIANSLKYGNDNGHTKLAFYDMDKYILIEVADNGIGIKETDLKRVFERFYRVDKSRSRTQGGSGLGLSIVKHIIEAHQQTVNVRSAAGVGSTFGFTLAKV